MITFRDASLEDREDFMGMNDFDLTPPQIAEIRIDDIDGQVLLGQDDNNKFRIEITWGDFITSLTGDDAAKAMVQLIPDMESRSLARLGFMVFHNGLGTNV